MEPEVIQAELVLPTHLSFKRIQMYEKYPKGQSRGRHWKHLKQIIQAENYQNYPPDDPNCKFFFFSFKNFSFTVKWVEYVLEEVELAFHIGLIPFISLGFNLFTNWISHI